MLAAFASPTSPPTETSPAEASPREDADDESATGAQTPYRTVVSDADDEDDGLGPQRRLDARSPGFATAVDLEHEQGARPADALGEVVARTPGATVRSIGGLGQFSAVSLRGSSPQQVQVFYDGVPIGGSLAGLSNLDELSLDGLTRIEVYRGYVPVAFGSATLGGAIDLVSDPSGGDEGRVQIEGGVGSYGARQSRVGVVTPIERDVHLSLRAGYAGAEGDFAYFDDGGTPTFTGDDVTRRRTNNHYDRVQGQARADIRRGPWRIAIHEIVHHRRQGIAGPARAPTRAMQLDATVSRTILTARRMRLGRPGGRLEWVSGLGITQRRFEDPLGEIGFVDDQRTSSIDAYVSPRMRLALWRGAFVRLVADQRTEWVDVQQRGGFVSPSGDATRLRAAQGAGLELEQFMFDRRWLLVPGIRFDALVNRFAVAPGEGEQDDRGRDDVQLGWSPRLGTRLRIVRGLELRASVGRYFRPPTLLELFGDQGYVVGNEGLSPERGTAIDGGFVVDMSSPHANAYLQVAGFATYSRDLIQWVSAGAVARPENIAAARVRGLEVGGVLAPDPAYIELQASYTLLHTEDRSDDPARRGQPLPGRPRHDVFARWSAGPTFWAADVSIEPRVFYTVDFIAGTFLDPSGRFELPPRAIQGAGTEIHVAGAVHLAVEVRNLLDVRTAFVTLPVAAAMPQPVAVSDFIGFPLPGRSIWATLRIDTDPRAWRAT